MVDSATERRVATGKAALQIDLVRTLELEGIAVARAPEHQDRRAGRYRHGVEDSVVGDGPHHVTERGLDTDHLFGEGRDLLRMPAEVILEVLTLGQDPDCVAEEAGGGLTTRAQRGCHGSRRTRRVRT